MNTVLTIGPFQAFAALVGFFAGVFVGGLADTPHRGIARPDWPCCACRGHPRRSLATASCHNSCPYASDGTCDDGGPESTYNLCGVATDCADCGPSLLSAPLPKERSKAQPLPLSPAPSSAHPAPPTTPSLPSLRHGQWQHDMWDTAAHPLWMVASGLYACWHAALNRPLVGLGVSCFFVGALASVALSLCVTLMQLAAQSQRSQDCCACSVFYVINFFPRVRAEAVFWFGVSLPSLLSLASLLRHFLRATREPADAKGAVDSEPRSRRAPRSLV